MKILPPNLPLYLYRYRSLAGTARRAREIEALTAPHIWCSDFDHLNDPMEGFYSPTPALKRAEDYDQIVDDLYDEKINVGIASFSDTNENELMWAHYADNYRGICIEYYPQRLLDALNNRYYLVRVGYGDSPPRVTTSDAEDRQTAVRKLLAHKKYNWVYEREWRVLGPLGRAKITPDCIRRVYLGSRIPLQTKRAIRNACFDHMIDVYAVTVDGYQHSWHPL
ncbi:DUF2971 domain-containing protein [Bradyrhizobium sp. OAE829]|uniref:DUF2971 domain-containing protein n=1 Tax=Bradyrhizobium sp. OAE829 TaxID=2663807 RepID=UPI00178ADBF4